MRINKYGDKEWIKDGTDDKLHRTDGPASELSDGTKSWWVNGKRHRADGLPAIEWASGTKVWFVDGKVHRDGGFPAIEWADGTKEWYVNGALYKI